METSRFYLALTVSLVLVAAACGREPIIEQLPMQPGDVDRTYADVTRASDLLDYAPSMPFNEGIQKLVDWLRRRPTDG